MESTKHFYLLIFLSGLFLIPDTNSQHKFELGVNVDPLVVPINIWTFSESGLGYYDINGKVKISQAGSAYISYWPFTSIGFSLGVGIRNFGSQIDYVIPDPIHENSEPLIDRSYPYSAKGWGPSFAVLWRTERWRARIGIATFTLYDQKYDSNYSTHAVTIWESGGDILVDIQAEEVAYWQTAPRAYEFLQFEGQYNILDNLYINVGFETTTSGQYQYPYTLLITGFTPETAPQSQVLNDCKMSYSLTSFSFGVGYIMGFGKYKNKTQENSER